MNQYTVLKQTECPHCNGGGVYTRNVRSAYDGKSYPQDFDCENCRGTGKIKVEVPLEVALKELGYAQEPK
jgi:DnaJ-class molecular chaperone